MKRPRMDVNLEELDGIIERGTHAPWGESESEKLKSVLHALVGMLPQPRSTEKTKNVLEQSVAPAPENEPEPVKGHGRNGASSYIGAQQHSEPLLKTLRDWMEVQFAQHLVEPNSGLGKAVTYFLRHWKGLTAFLRDAGAPLDNNICERALKRAVLHRKNALFYRTLHGSEVGDLFMSLIHTCELADANAFDYLTQLQRHADELVANPSAWMPWNYLQQTQPGQNH